MPYNRGPVSIPRRPQARFSLLHAQNFFQQGGTRVNGYSVQNDVTAESAFDAVRLALSNRDTSLLEVAGFDKIMVAPSSTLSDGISPTNAAGVVDNTLWVPLTFDKGGAGGVPTELVSGGTRRNFNGMPPAVLYNGADMAERYVFTDLVPVKSLARTDVVGALPLLFIRAYAAGYMPVCGTSGMLADWAAYNGGRTVSSYQAYGDAVSTPTTAWTGTTAGNYVIPGAVQFQFRRRGLNVVTFGDSTGQGDWANGVSGGHNGPMKLACQALSTPDVPVTFCMKALTGSRSPSFMKQLQAYLDAFEPDVVEFPMHTPNESASTQSIVDLAFDTAIAAANLCVSRRIVPIVSLPIPWNWTSTTLTIMTELVARAKAMLPSFAYVADRYGAVVDTGGTGGTALAAYVSGVSPYHMVTAGNQAIATQALQPILAKILAMGPTP